MKLIDEPRYRFRCKNCSAVLSAFVRYAGKTARCKCGSKFRIPDDILQPSQSGSSELMGMSYLDDPHESAKRHPTTIPKTVRDPHVSISDLSDLLIAQRHRQIIRHASLWFGFQCFCIVVMVIALLIITSSLNSSGTFEGPGVALGFLFAMAIGALCFFAARETYDCKVWAPIAMMILYIVNCLVRIMMLVVNNPPMHLTLLQGGLAIIVCAVLCYWFCYRAIVAIEKFSKQPVWCRNLILNAESQT